jgi:hypothetical protein
MYFEKEDETDYRHDLAINDWNVHFRRLSVWSAAARLSSLSLDVDLDALQRSGQNWQNALATIPPHATMSDGDRCYFRYCIEGVVDCHLFQESELGTPLKLLGHSNAAVRFDAAAHLLWIAEKRDPDPAGVRARHWIRTSIQRGEDLLRAVSEALVEPGQSFACSEDFVREPNPMARRALFLLGGYAQGQRGAWLPRTLLKREAARIELDLLREALPGLQGKLLALCRVLKTG